MKSYCKTIAGRAQTVKPGPHRTRQHSPGPAYDRPSASRPVPSRQKPPPAALGGVFDGTERTERARTVANSAGTALTGAMWTGIGLSRLCHIIQYSRPESHGIRFSHRKLAATRSRT